ncbi:MAG TPA: hypothetical protein VLL54_16375 [Pyrinomonadaceae bacterium]|nr:hypothetical protein [Pyrinomonadaceae bacterium]
MNCKDFNEIIDDIADYRPMLASIREASVSHAALCPDCAAKLADARAVGSSLLQAARAESDQAPPRVKENLLAAFAEIHSPHATSSRVVDISSRRKTRSWIAVAAAIAAVVLLAVIISVWRKSSVLGVPQQDLQAGNNPSSPHVDEPKPGSSPDFKKPEDKEVKLTATKREVNPPRLKRPLRESGSPRQGSETVAQNSGSYLPLTYLARGADIDSGTVVRVELSRAALARLGFTRSVDGSSESVRADVILGDDGVARAIRLVD